MRLSSLWHLFLSLFLLTARTQGGDSSTPEEPSRFVRSPYLQFAATNQVHVVWRTAGPMTAGVKFGTQLGALTETVEAKDIVVRASLGPDGKDIPARWQSLRTAENLALPELHSAPVGTFQYEARISNLRPATRYYYAIFDGEERLTPSDPGYSIRTPPATGSRGPVRFSVLGDSGTGRLPQKDVYDAMLGYAATTRRDFDFWIHVGDMAYGQGRDMEFQTRVFEPYEGLMRRTVCWPTMGNHEGGTSKGTTGIGPYYDAYVVPTRGEAGGVASGNEAYYSFNHANIHFICLNSHDLDRRPSGAMARWLKADLEKAQAEWLIAFWHHPPYTKGSHDSDKETSLKEMREYIMPIIESGGVDIVLTGHSHIYERSMLMDGAYATPTVSENVILDDGDGNPEGDGSYRKSAGLLPHRGTVQIVAGHGGQSLGRSGSLPVMKTILVEYGSVVVDVNGDTLTAAMISRQGGVRDLFTLVKQGKVEVRRISLPWQPPEYKKPESEERSPATPAVNHRVLIPANAEWRYLSGEHPQGRNWTRSDFTADRWSVGKAGFGFGDGSIATRIEPARGRAPAVYLLKEFEIGQADAVTELGLLADYSDGFIAYLNGREVARQNIGRSSGRNVQNVKSRTARGPAYIALRNAPDFLRDGVNVLAIEAHANAGVLDFFVDLSLVIED